MRKLDELGFTLVEVVLSIPLLGICLVLLIGFMQQQQNAVESMRQKEVAIAVRTDIQQWMKYTGQYQEIQMLNSYALAVLSPEDELGLTREQKIRRSYFLLDESGVEWNASGKGPYGEVWDHSGSVVRNHVKKIQYGLTPNEVPQKLGSSEEELKMIGEYLDGKKQRTGYLVKVVTGKRKKTGLMLTIQVYLKKSGVLLTESTMNWSLV